MTTPLAHPLQEPSNYQQSTQPEISSTREGIASCGVDAAHALGSPRNYAAERPAAERPRANRDACIQIRLLMPAVRSSGGLGFGGSFVLHFQFAAARKRHGEIVGALCVHPLPAFHVDNQVVASDSAPPDLEEYHLLVQPTCAHASVTMIKKRQLESCGLRRLRSDVHRRVPRTIPCRVRSIDHESACAVRRKDHSALRCPSGAIRRCRARATVR